MPLSKAKQAEWMREYRKRVRYNVIPEKTVSIPLKLTPVRNIYPDVGYNVIPKRPQLDADGQVMPDYD